MSLMTDSSPISARELLMGALDVIRARDERIGELREQNRTLRRVIVLLCLLGLGLIAYGFLHNAFLSAATAMWVGAPMGDWIA